MAKEKTSDPAFTDTDKAALDAAAAAGMTDPAAISPTSALSPEEMTTRIVSLEMQVDALRREKTGEPSLLSQMTHENTLENLGAIVKHIVETYHRNLDLPAIIAKYHDDKEQAGEVLDPTAKGRA